MSLGFLYIENKLREKENLYASDTLSSLHMASTDPYVFGLVDRGKKCSVLSFVPLHVEAVVTG